jgi:2-oxoglutarate ferredoxin oxidoreductase subunit gamma
MKHEVRISGFGGQGVALAAMVLGKAAVLYEDLEGVMTQSYGLPARMSSWRMHPSPIPSSSRLIS